VQIFTSSQMMDLKAAFTMFDKNGDQKISGSELKEVMHYLGLKTSEDEVKAMIQVVDKNRNGYVDYDEFIQMMTQTQIKPLNADEELKKTFNIFDIDGNGYICHDEIKKTMEHLGESVTDEEVNDMIKAADKNGDGRIDINEFSGLLNGVTSRK
jgi:calmodulin